MAGVTVLYGSQTGCAESIAQQIYNDALSRQLEAQLLPLNDFQKANIESKPGHHVIIVCSTTGNGEPPDNAGKFWRYVKRRTQPKDMLVNLSFTVLGLGDTNYDRFCYMGKNIDKRFAELGAQRYYPMCAADEALGLEDMVEPWLAGLWAAFDKSYGTTGGDDDATGTSSGSDVGPESEVKSADGKVQDIAAHDDADLRKYLPANLISYEKMFGPLSGPTQAPDDVPRLQVPMFQTQYQDEQTTVATPATTGVDSEEWSISNPFLGSIVAAKYLTSSESERKVLGLEIDLGNSGIQFKPGDSIGVKCPNRSDEVEALLARLDLDGSKKVIVESTASSGRSSKKAATSSSRFPTSSTVRDLFLQYTDIRSSPKKAVVRALATYCSDVEEQAQMLVLSSKQGASKYKALIEEQQVSFLELLLLFPSCHPPLDHVLSLLPQLMPRYYSIASSPLADSKRVTVAFTVVDYTVGPQGIRRRGLCTNWLQEIAQPLLDGHSQSSGEAAVDVGIKVPVYLRPTRDFQLPADLQSPMVLIGPGTGVAPFIGFLQHRQLQVMDANKNGGDEEVPASTEAGPISLFFGCRRKSEDWIFRNDMESYLANGTLSSLFTAFSRDQAEKHYVQHDLIANGKLVYDLIHEGEGFVFVCGDGVSMARDVHAALVQIVEKHGNLSSEDAEGILRSLAGAQRYVRDIW